MKTAVIYARFSSDKQRDASIDDQLRVCRDYAQREGFMVVREYCDYAMSGRSDDRPRFQDMISNAGESDAVIVYMMDRLSRDAYDAPYYKHILAKRGVRVLSAMEYIPEGADGIVFEKLLEGLAARESMITGIRARRGMEGNALKCEYNGDRVYGYSVDPITNHYEVDDYQAAFVRECFERRKRHEPMNAIARDFAARGVKTYTNRPCSPSMVANMLRNEKYTGVYIWGNVRVEGGMPAIIDRETFDAVQSIRGRRARKMEEWSDYALSGRALCGKCGHNLHGESAYNHAKVRYDYYVCKPDSFRIGRDKLEGTIVDALRDMLTGDEAYEIAHHVQKAWRESSGVKALEAAESRSKAASCAKAKIVRAVEEGMPWAAVRDRFEELDREEMQAKADMAMHAHDADFSVEDFVEFLRFGATLDDRHLLDAFVHQALVFEDKLVVVLNYNEKETNQPKMISLDWFEKNTNGSPDVREHEHGVSIVGKLIMVIIPIAA